MTGGRVSIFCACYKSWTVMTNVGRYKTCSWAEFMKFNQHRYSRRTVVLKITEFIADFRFVSDFVGHLTLDKREINERFSGKTLRSLFKEYKIV
jgi:hypothetical protein